MPEARGVPIPAPVDAQTSSRMGELTRRILSTAVLLPLFVWILLGTPAWAFTVMIVGVGMLANWEFTRMFERAGVPVLRDAGLIWGGLVTLAFARADRAGAAFALVVIGQDLSPGAVTGFDDLVTVHRVPDDPVNAAALERAGIPPVAYYLLRPDGYIGLAGTRFDAAVVSRYLRDRIGLTPPTSRS